MPYQLHERRDYVEVEVDGVLDSVSMCIRELSTRAKSKNVLLNLEHVTSVNGDTYALAGHLQEIVLKGYRLAFYAPRPALFGVSRQALQLGNVEEGSAASVFTALDAAREWLLSA
ncbi:MAG: hypothetical protein AB7N24_14175 [Dehalococcoidia bacterium]